MRSQRVSINPPKVKELDLYIKSKVQRKKRKSNDSDFVFSGKLYDKFLK